MNFIKILVISPMRVHTATFRFKWLFFGALYHSELSSSLDSCHMRVHREYCFFQKYERKNDIIGKMDDLIEMPFGSVSGVGPRNRVLDGPAYWRHLINTVERLKDWLYISSSSSLTGHQLLYFMYDLIITIHQGLI